MPKKPKEHCNCGELKAQVQDYEQLLKRVQADFDNYRKHADNDKGEARLHGKIDLVKKLLPILDNFALAMQHADNPEEFKKGIELIYAEVNSLFKQEGLEKIPAKGHKLDTDLHDVLLTAESDQPEDTILEELQPGYTFKDKVIRHTKVKIAK